MAISIYFNPLDNACKSIIGGIKQGGELQFNLFLLKNRERVHCGIPNYNFKTPSKGDCIEPSQNAFLRIKRDGESFDLFEMKKTEF